MVLEVVLWDAMSGVDNRTMLWVTKNHTTTIRGLHSYHKIRKKKLIHENKIHYFGSKIAN
jgi:hypothetical protein